MLVNPEHLERLVKSISDLFKVLGIKTESARAILSLEIIFGVFIVLILLIVEFETVYQSIYAAIRHQKYDFHSDKYPTMTVIFMFVSVFLVFLRERLGH